jgi:hypothetical protein
MLRKFNTAPLTGTGRRKKDLCWYISSISRNKKKLCISVPVVRYVERLELIQKRHSIHFMGRGSGILYQKIGLDQIERAMGGEY